MGELNITSSRNRLILLWGRARTLEDQAHGTEKPVHIYIYTHVYIINRSTHILKEIWERKYTDVCLLWKKTKETVHNALDRANLGRSLFLGLNFPSIAQGYLWMT